MVPKIQSTVDAARQARSPPTLPPPSGAGRGRRDRGGLSPADGREPGRGDEDHCRGQGRKAPRRPRQRVAKADAAIQAKLAKAEEQDPRRACEARAEIEAVAAELTQEIAGKVAGLKVSRDDAATAVKAELTHG